MSKRRILDRSLMHMAARLHYLDGLSQRDVAKKLDISTASASRVLARAREEGVVQIKVADIFEADVLGARLAAALGLRAASVCESGRPHEMASRVAELLREGDLPGSPVIAISWGRTVQSVLLEGLPKLPGSVIVPCIGGMEETEPHFQINELVRLAAGSTGGQAMFLHAPYLASSELRAVLERVPKSHRVVESWGKVDAAILGSGPSRRLPISRRCTSEKPTGRGSWVTSRAGITTSTAGRFSGRAKKISWRFRGLK